MTSENTHRTEAVRAVATALSRPYSDVDAKAAEVLDKLTAAGWRAPPAAQPNPLTRPDVRPASDAFRRQKLAEMRAELAHKPNTDRRSVDAETSAERSTDG